MSIRLPRPDRMLGAMAWETSTPDRTGAKRQRHPIVFSHALEAGGKSVTRVVPSPVVGRPIPRWAVENVVP